jgi:malate dehydrogenase
VIKAAQGESSITEPTYVYLPGVPGGDAVAKETGCEYFSVPVTLGKGGVESIENVLGKVNEYEKKLLEKCYEGLKGNIEKGVTFAQTPKEESK